MLKTGEDIKNTAMAFSELKHNLINCYGKHEFNNELSSMVRAVVDLECKFENVMKDTEQYKEYRAEQQKELNEWCEKYRKLNAEVTSSTENHISNYYGDSWDKDSDGNWHRTSWGF